MTNVAGVGLGATLSTPAGAGWAKGGPSEIHTHPRGVGAGSPGDAFWPHTPFAKWARGDPTMAKPERRAATPDKIRANSYPQLCGAAAIEPWATPHHVYGVGGTPPRPNRKEPTKWQP